VRVHSGAHRQRSKPQASNTRASGSQTGSAQSAASNAIIKVDYAFDQSALLLERITMNGNRYYGVRVEGAKYGVGFGSALAIAISYTNNHSILWAIIHGILGWLYVIYVALFG
jgi:hypothetical protein